LAQSELAIIQPRTIHCTPLHYCTAPVGRRWDHPRLGKFSNHVCSLLDTGCTVPPGERSSCNERHAGSVANKYFLLKNVWPKRREAYVSKPRHYRQDKNEKALLRKARNRRSHDRVADISRIEIADLRNESKAAPVVADHRQLHRAPVAERRVCAPAFSRIGSVSCAKNALSWMRR
jgi:hypothetical protein